jgi:hypothetical protein
MGVRMPGIGVRIESESVAGFNRNGCPDETGIRTLFWSISEFSRVFCAGRAEPALLNKNLSACKAYARGCHDVGIAKRLRAIELLDLLMQRNTLLGRFLLQGCRIFTKHETNTAEP